MIGSRRKRRCWRRASRRRSNSARCCQGPTFRRRGLTRAFAVLLDSLWTGHTDSPHRFECQMWETARRIARFDSSETGKPMVYRHFTDPEKVFRFDGGKVYVKGAWVLQMLRHQPGGSRILAGRGEV